MYYQCSYVVPGTLAANLNIRWYVPFDCQLISASAVASNDSDATITLHKVDSANTVILAATTIGDSNVPRLFRMADFVDGQFPRLTYGQIMRVTVDYDGAAGTAAQDVTLVFTFMAG